MGVPASRETEVIWHMVEDQQAARARRRGTRRLVGAALAALVAALVALDVLPPAVVGPLQQVGAAAGL